ncbi:MAG: HPr family phosphocarrier protein [Lachnospiraceae bacterium]|nr:HPr family phosphocarrier protein [Lachnospiraceae bacterium]
MEEYVIIFHSLKQIYNFVHWAEEIPYHMDISHGSIIVDGKSIQGIMAVGLEQELHLHVYGQLQNKDKPYIQQFTK